MSRNPLFPCLTGLFLLIAGCGVDDSHEGDDPGECTDNEDNDDNGAIDCDDDGCSQATACSGDDDAPTDDDDSATDDDDTTDDDDSATDDDDTTDDDDSATDDDDDSATDDDDSATDDDDTTTDDDDDSATDDDDTTTDDDDSAGDDDDDDATPPTGTIGEDCLGPVSYLPLECATVSGDTICYDAAFDQTWQWSPPVQDFDWTTATAYCQSLTFAGGTDWHVPTLCQARSIIRNCAATEYGGACGVSDACIDYTCWTQDCASCPVGTCLWAPELTGGCSNDYWTEVETLGTTNTAWFVGYYNGSIYNSSEFSQKRVRCVHDGPLQP